MYYRVAIILQDNVYVSPTACSGARAIDPRCTDLKVFGFKFAPCHDPCAVAYLLDPAKFTTKKMRVDVETSSELAAGQTICDTYLMSRKPINATVAMAIEVDWFWGEIVGALARAAPKDFVEADS